MSDVTVLIGDRLGKLSWHRDLLAELLRREGQYLLHLRATVDLLRDRPGYVYSWRDDYLYGWTDYSAQGWRTTPVHVWLDGTLHIAAGPTGFLQLAHHLSYSLEEKAVA